jgi:membrane-associated phospholipid phosphatase
MSSVQVMKKSNAYSAHSRRCCCAALGLLFLTAASIKAQSVSSVFSANPGDLSQHQSSPANKSLPDSPQPHVSTDQAALDERADVNWHRLPKNFVQDQKDMWLFPLQLAKGKYWLPTLFIVGGTAALVATDPQTAPHFRQIDAFQDTSGALSAKVSGGIIAGVPATFYIVGLLRHDRYDQATSLFAGEAVVDDTILMVVLKAITRRERPSDRPINGPYNDTFFKSNSGPLGKGSSFPSGHAMMSFSIATVFARRYKEHKWLPWVAYGTATFLSFTRLTTGAHFPSEVFLGAATGFVIARFDVLHGR